MIKLCLVLVLLAACNPIDTTEAQEVCTEVVKDGLAQCTASAWELCDKSYQEVLVEIQAENAALRADLIKLHESYAAGCSGFVNGAVNDFMEVNGCQYFPESQYGWVCDSGRLCQATP